MPSGVAAPAATDSATGTRTKDRLIARAYLRNFTRLKRVSDCGHALGGAVSVRHGEHGGISGLTTCGSVWACPVCSAKIAQGRYEDLERAVRQWVDVDGGSMAMLTLTISHNRGHRLEDLWDAVSRVWRTFVGHRRYRDARARMGVVGYLRTTEVVYSDQGWHVHLHVLFFLRGRPGVAASNDFGGLLTSLWIAAARAHDYSAHHKGQKWQTLTGSADALEEVARYVNKGVFGDARTRTARTVALEVTRGDLKDYRFTESASRSPFMILEDLCLGLDSDAEPRRDRRLWREWERASKNRRQQTWSRGLRSLLQLDAPPTDEELAAREDAKGVELVQIRKREWHRLSKCGAWHVRVITLASLPDYWEARDALIAFLDSIGIAFDDPSYDMDDGPAVPRMHTARARAA